MAVQVFKDPYALSGTTHPISVAEWETQLTRALPDDLRDSLPSIEAIERELGMAGGENPDDAGRAGV